MKLNGWQRLWVVIGLTLLMLVSGIVAANLPTTDYVVLSDLRSDDCKYIRSIPDGFILDTAPTSGQPCYALGSLKNTVADKLSSVEEYRAFIQEEQVEMISKGLSLWLAAVVVLYAVGWGFDWIRKGFKADRSSEQ
ncbi:hypothetical protein ACW73L_19080 [Methylolobus aquaticus]